MNTCGWLAEVIFQVLREHEPCHSWICTTMQDAKAQGLCSQGQTGHAMHRPC